jgi:hypothetical protein
MREAGQRPGALGQDELETARKRLEGGLRSLSTIRRLLAA